MIGTHTNNEQNQLIIVKVRLPLQDTNSDVKDENKDFILPKIENKLEFEIKINHAGEVNKARHMPQKYNIIATKTISGEIHIFDYFKHPTKPSDLTVKPNLVLKGHTKEGFGLSWNTKKEGYIISGSNDYRVKIDNNIRLVCGI